jgi:hypothetical protein
LENLSWRVNSGIFLRRRNKKPFLDTDEHRLTRFFKKYFLCISVKISVPYNLRRVIGG